MCCPSRTSMTRGRNAGLKAKAKLVSTVQHHNKYSDRIIKIWYSIQSETRCHITSIQRQVQLLVSGSGYALNTINWQMSVKEHTHEQVSQNRSISCNKLHRLESEKIRGYESVGHFPFLLQPNHTRSISHPTSCNTHICKRHRNRFLWTIYSRVEMCR